MDVLGSIITIVILLAIVAFAVFKIVFKTRCIKCREKFTPQDMLVSAGELKWVRKEKKEEKSTQGALYATGTNYVEITKYKVYYRLVTFYFKCPKCAKTKVFVKRYNLYDGSSNYSMSAAEMTELLRRKIRKTLGRKFLNGQEVKIKNIDF